MKACNIKSQAREQPELKLPYEKPTKQIRSLLRIALMQSNAI